MTESSPPLIYRSGGPLLQRIAEIDTATKRLKLSRRLLGRWDKTLVDCSFDDCVALGTVEYSSDGNISFGTYFKLKNGRSYSIPLSSGSFESASNLVIQVANATDIPRLDIKYS